MRRAWLRMRRLLPGLLVVILGSILEPVPAPAQVTLTPTPAPAAAATPPADQTIAGEVTSVSDGDTFRIGDVRIRLLGINAPERDQPLWEHGVAVLSAAVEGAEVVCEATHQDQHGRMVATCSDGLGRDLGEVLVREGAAEHRERSTCRDVRFEARLCDLYRAAEEAARESRVGLWAEPQ